MAQKRMFDKTITNSDDFIDMPDSSQNLYFHLSMNADDDGFVNNWKSIMRMTGHKEDDLKVLISKQFVIPFESGVIVIKHWRINNYLRNDRYVETKFKDEKNSLVLDENMVYQMSTNGIPSIEENSIDKNRIKYKERNIIKKESFVKPTLEEVKAYCKERNNNVDPQRFYDYYEANDWKDGKGNKVKSWKQKMIANWETNTKQQNKKEPRDFDVSVFFDDKEELKQYGIQ